MIVAAYDLLPGLRQRAGNLEGELLEFTDADAMSALQTIKKRRPGVVALERTFAVTPRGTALIKRIKADPNLWQAEIRVMAHNGDYTRVVPRAAATGAPALDHPCRRRAPRFKTGKQVTAVLNGKSVTIIELSTVGAQVVTAGGLKPDQRIVMALADGASHLELTASVAWTSFEMSASGAPCYRAGLNFEDADPAAVNAFCARHRK